MAKKNSDSAEPAQRKQKKEIEKIKAPKFKETKATKIKDNVSGFFVKRKKVLKERKNNAQDKLKTKFAHLKRIIFPRDIVLKGQEPPKSYAYTKKFYGLYGIFVFYSFVLILGVNFPDNPIINLVTLYHPFEFSNTVLSIFILLSVLLSYDKFRMWVFEDKFLKVMLKQALVYTVLFIPVFLFFVLVISTNYNITSILLMLSMFWLFLLSSKFYTYSRRFSTNIEVRFISKYSRFRSLIGSITPIFILGLLVVLSLIYRGLLVFLTLDLLGYADPSGAVIVYQTEMILIMPLIYFSLILTLIFIVFEYVLTRRLAETKRAGKFDNFTFSLIVLFIFFFQLMEVTIFLFLRPETMSVIENTLGTNSSALMYIFIFEFLISMYFLYRVMLKTGKTFGWRLLFFKKDGLILFLLACVFSQTLTRFALSNVPNQQVTDIGTIFMYDKWIISVLMIIFLGMTLMIYYLKPQQTSMFMRMMKETVSEEEKETEQVYQIIRNEYIRRGEPYPLNILEREIIKATKLSLEAVTNIIDHLAEKHMDIVITEEEVDAGKKIRMVDFVSITETFEKKDVAEKKAKKYLSNRLFETASAEKRGTMELGNDLQEDKASDQFISSLTSSYSKDYDTTKSRDKDKLNAKKKLTVERELSPALKNQIIGVIKKEYVYRIENEETYPDFHYAISEITNEIYRLTKMTSGELYPILRKFNESDLEIRLIDNPEEPEDKKIKIFPITDDSMCYSLASFRPEEYVEVKQYVVENYLKLQKQKQTISKIKDIKKTIPNQTESQKGWLELLTLLIEYYPDHKKQLFYLPNTDDLIKLIATFPKKEIITE